MTKKQQKADSRRVTIYNKFPLYLETGTAASKLIHLITPRECPSPSNVPKAPQYLLADLESLSPP